MRWAALAPIILIALVPSLGQATEALVPSPQRAEEDVVEPYPLKTGEVIEYQNLHKLKGYIPPPFWEHREYFFFEGMQLRIGALDSDYSPSDLRKQVTAEYGRYARIGRDERGEGWLDFYLVGTPFAEIDPNDPDAGFKVAWNARHRHDPMEGGAHFRLASWERPGQTTPSFAYLGYVWGIRLAHRTDKVDARGKYFQDEKREAAGRIRLDMPMDLRSLAAVGYRYLGADSEPLADEIRDAWVWLPSLRRVRRVPGSSEEEEAIPGTQFMIQDIDGFNFASGLTQKFEFKLAGEAQVLTPIDTTVKAFPLVEFPNLGPSGFSFANDTWQLRDAWVLWIRKRAKTPAYSKKLLWIDKETYMPLYAAGYDGKGELWRLIYLVHRWSESPAHQEVVSSCKGRGDHRQHLARESPLAHPAIEGGERYLYSIGHVAVNVRNGKGSRIEAWDAHATHLRDKDIRRNLDSNRLVIGAR
jgi:hypothetical protein